MLGTLTIGQAPRSDITPIIDAILPAGMPRRHAGVLDGLSTAEIADRFAPLPGEALLVTRLLDGSSVVIGRGRTEAAAREKIAMLEAEGCGTVLMLCTGHFETLVCRSAHLVEPDRILPPAVAALVGLKRLGVVVPLAGQVDTEAAKWHPLAQPPIFAAASPYDGDDASLEAAAADLAQRGADILLLDCMGFVEKHRAIVAAAACLPVILSNSMIAKLVSEIV